MSINYAILGILSYKSMTGYDLKKIIQDSTFMHWSGNNNQIYKSLVELLDKGLVTNVVKHQDSSPSKKIYTITSEGLATLKDWVLFTCDPIEIKKPFLVQLAWSKQLNTSELNMLLDGYENQIKMQLLMQQSNKKDTIFSPNRTNLETRIWNLINDNIRRIYENELVWIQDVRNAIINIPNENDIVDSTKIKVIGQKEKRDGIMKYTVNSNNEISYVHFNDSETKLETERNILDIITALAENNIQFVLLDSETLSKNFLELKKGLLGTLLQKFTMYHIKSAIVIKDVNSLKSEFRDSIAESRKHDVLRLFTNIADAEKWFLSLKQKGKF
ncbi:MAG: PadR family transcriptional regulator [Clostridiales bacterium GWB2_37_7]|nr:MAG: PadR family transcriptional regulator [Clostridiales bacterium GWB2_37_7]